MRLFEQHLGLEQVDDVDAIGLPVDVAAHVGVPAPRLVAEVDSGLKQLSQTYFGHLAPLSVSVVALTVRGDPALRAGQGPHRRPQGVAYLDWVSVVAGVPMPGSNPSSATRQNASTTAGSNCFPALRRSSSIAPSWLSEALYARLERIAS